MVMMGTPAASSSTHAIFYFLFLFCEMKNIVGYSLDIANQCYHCRSPTTSFENHVVLVHALVLCGWCVACYRCERG
jgi:hypothetical protein